MPDVVPLVETAVLNLCTRWLARSRGVPAEAWRFPFIEGHLDPAGVSTPRNRVTFVFDARGRPAETSVGVIGTFATLYEPVPLVSVLFRGQATGFFACTLLVATREVHRYKFMVDGVPALDAINPQRVRTEDGAEWSRFFTEGCTEPLCFDRSEYRLLLRLTDHVLPFRTPSAEAFLKEYYYTRDRQSRSTELPLAHRLDDPVGVVNYIDNVLAREESHRLVDYRICLSLIDALLRRRNPFVEPGDMPRDMFAELYDQMTTENVPGWDYGRYQSPRFFLELLRRHAVTGAFSHPKYGGNAGGAAWAYLEERYMAGKKTLFDWRAAIEPPLGASTSYRG